MSLLSLRLARELAARLVEPVVDPRAPESRVSRELYTSPAVLADERARIFRGRPLMIGPCAALDQPGACITSESAGVSIIVTRGPDGILRGFKNACRHRGTRLVNEPTCAKKAFVCPYHGWTYDLSGALIHVPHEEAFSQLDPTRRSLVPVRVEERHGLIWVTVDGEATPSVGEYLRDIDGELTALGLSNHVVFARRVCERAANWKLVIELFLESYHLRTLHRESIYRFFLDARTAMEDVGPHMAAVSARRELAAFDGQLDGDNLRSFVTPNFNVFPNTIIIAHPDYVSCINVVPLAVDRLRWDHTILVPHEPENAEERDRWQRSVDLIDGQVFQREDLAMAEEIQAGLATGADEDVLIGKLEAGITRFHEALRQAGSKTH